MKISIEEKDESQTYRPVPVDQLFEMLRNKPDRIVIYVPNLCGGETRISIFKSSIPEGNPENLARLLKLK